MAPNESLHSLMKCIGERSKNSSQALFNARTILKSFLAKHESFMRGYSGNAAQVNVLMRRAKSLQDACMNAGRTKEEAKEFMQAVVHQRFERPSPRTSLSRIARVLCSIESVETRLDSRISLHMLSSIASR